MIRNWASAMDSRSNQMKTNKTNDHKLAAVLILVPMKI
jgi:hypothetical protein